MADGSDGPEEIENKCLRYIISVTFSSCESPMSVNKNFLCEILKYFTLRAIAFSLTLIMLPMSR